jgi:hypothetical protein
MQLVSTLCFLSIAQIHARNVGDPSGLSLGGTESVNIGPTEGNHGENERRGLSNTCSDVIDWHDSDGDCYDCYYYEDNNECATHGDDFLNQGHTANTGCCFCGGGLYTTCSDVIDWHDSAGVDFDCKYYKDHNECATHGDDWANQGHTANTACCFCGGGSTGTTYTTCSDVIDWHDSAGVDFDCKYYKDGNECATHGDDWANQGHTANTACCFCGGGTTYNVHAFQDHWELLRAVEKYNRG